jgi:predicted lipoprotein with Yx(FWY)xxD motif
MTGFRIRPAPLLVLAVAAIAGLAISTLPLGSAPASVAERAKPVRTPERAELELVRTRFGRIIHETRSGLVAYLFTKDRRRKSRCTGRCAKAWPPIKTKRAPLAGDGIRRSRLGTIRRRGGAKMVTYRGRPLYFYEHDSPGEILCHDVREFGGDWFVVKRNGKPA